MTGPQEVETRIRERVSREVVALPDSLRGWAESHLTTPRLVQAFLDPDTQQSLELWTVTADIGERDSSYLVVYDATQDSFGLVARLQDGRLWFLGLNGSFAAAVEDM